MSIRNAALHGAARRGQRSRDVVARVDALARNLWWTWNPDPQRLLAALDPALWEATGHNPIRTLRLLPPERRAALAGDGDFLALLGSCERQLAAYLAAPTWYERRARRGRLLVAYFCAEYGLHECLPQYAGGLGVLAGDHLKSASDLGIPLVGVGLLYRCGYYRQELRPDGTTRVLYPRFDFSELPLRATGRSVRVPLGRRAVTARIWEARIGRVPLYLLDTDVPANRRRDRAITAQLYGGDATTRIRQEIVLGVGGVRALAALGVRASVFHLNEGHAAFCALERLRSLRAAGVPAARALARVRASTVFTAHTPVPAGHDRFPPALARRWLAPLLADAGLAPEQWLAFGRVDPRDPREPLCMTVLALRLAARCNGVSARHGAVARRMWQPVFGARRPEDVPIGHITNGIHAATWLAPEIRPLYRRYLAPVWRSRSPADDGWRRAGRIPAAELWRVRTLLRRRLVEFVRLRLRQQLERRGAADAALRAALETLDEHALTIGFARRFATYKRAPLIFHDRQRLAAILNDPRRPVQLVLAGKAHPADRAGQRFAQLVHRHAQAPGLRGRVVLLEDYDMHMARVLTSGCDVWLNTPVPPQEASGTSGMKSALHGGLNGSIPDGWWPEAWDGRNGWVIGDGQPPPRPAARDRRDAEALYTLLETEIVPLFYARGRDGVPRGWVRRMAAALRTICGRFHTHRMLAEYLELYAPS